MGARKGPQDNGFVKLDPIAQPEVYLKAMGTASLGRAFLAEMRADKTGYKPKKVRFVKRGDPGKSQNDINLFSPAIPITFPIGQVRKIVIQPNRHAPHPDDPIHICTGDV